MTSDSFRTALNDEQYAAVTAPDGPVLVLAAAGTGKTRTLVYRVGHLTQSGVDPQRILLLTFTNKAAREMLSRAEALIGPGVSGVLGGTFHHLANRILRRYGPHIGLDSSYVILDREDSKKLVSNCVKECGKLPKEFPRANVLLGLFGEVANTATPIQDVVADRFDDFDVDEDVVIKIHGDYVARKHAMSAVDFDDMLVRCLQLLKEQPRVLERYQQQFIHVLVDEYQDTNVIQAEMVDLLAAGRRNLMVVGDDFQSIYSWRGADYTNILTFPDRYTDANVYKLETNYRSVPEVLEVANACIRGNPHQFQKTLLPTRESYKRPRVARLRDPESQARFVADRIRAFRREGYRYSDIAVLYRAHFHAMEVERLLPRERIPYEITSGVRFYEQAHIKDVCSLLRLLVHPGDEMAFARLFELLPGVGPKSVIKLWTQLGREFNTADPEARQTVMDGLRAPARAVWKDVDPVLAAYWDEGLSAAPGEVIDRFVTAFYHDYAGRAFEMPEERLDDVAAFASDTARFESLETFLSDIALQTNLDAEAESEHGETLDTVRLSTIHQAKGLEWSAVIVLWACDGMFPSSRSLKDTEDGEAEERRLFYVTVTRAKDELILCAPEIRFMRDGGVVPYKVSRFIEEIPPDLLTVVRPGFM